MEEKVAQSIELFNKIVENGYPFLNLKKGCKKKLKIFSSKWKQTTPDDLTFNTMVRGFLETNDTHKAVQLLNSMVERGFLPDA